MPSEGRAKYNNTYYIANADDISYNNKLARRDAKTIICGCGSSIKDYSSSKSVHKKTNKHQIYEITMDIIETVADKYKAIIKLRNKARRLLVEGMDEKPKPVVKEKPKPVENVVISTEPVTPHNPPSATFDPLSMMGTSNGDIDGL